MPHPLISPEDLRDRLQTTVLVDVRPDAAAYAAGHLSGAFYADLNRDLSTATRPEHDPQRGGRHPLPSAADFARLAAQWGIRPDRDVVVYDSAGGANAAARLWWMLRSIGHERVQVLDGGLPAALAAGLSTDLAVPELAPPVAVGEQHWGMPTVNADTVDLRKQSSQWKLLDVRSSERFRGDHEPLDPVAGHIPGAVNLPFGQNLNPDGRFKSPSKLRNMYSALLQNTEPQQLMVMCGSGVTACHTLLALEHAGLPGALLYVGSWGEWCRGNYERATGSH